MSVTIGENFYFYSIKEISEELEISIPVVHKYVKKVKYNCTPQIWQVHTRTLNGIFPNQKRPTLYLSEDIVKLIKNQLNCKKYVDNLRKNLPSDKNKLKDMIIELMLPNDKEFDYLLTIGGGRRHEQLK